MKTIIRCAMCCTAMLGLAGVSHSARAAEGDGWQWIVAPYAWGASVGTDLKTKVPLSPSSGGLTFNNIIDHTSGFFEGHVEGQGDHFGMFADYTYLGLSDSHTRRYFRTSSSLHTHLFEAAAVWNPSGKRFSGFEGFGGLRYISAGLELKLTPADPAFPIVRFAPNKSYSDFMLGARYTFDLSDRWALTLRGDGSWGQTDGTWNVSSVAQYKMKHGAWAFGYRYLSVALKTRHSVTDITMSGPMIGYAFKF